MVKKNYAHVPVLEPTKKELEDLKDKLKEFYYEPTYDELIKILVEKNKKVVLSGNDVRKIMNKSRGVRIWTKGEIYSN